MFEWGINLPPDFEEVSAEDWDVIKNRGVNALEESTGGEIEDEAKTIFVFKNGDLNYMESNYQNFDEAVDGNYLQSCRDVNSLLYQTFEGQMEGTVLDSTSFTETISGLEFHVFNVNISFPNQINLRTYMYSRLFDKKEFTVNIMYVDAIAGEKMFTAWKNSSFN